MMVEFLGIVVENFDNTDIVVHKPSGEEEIVGNNLLPRIGPNELIKPGYVVEVEEYRSGLFIDFIKSKNGFSIGNTPGRVRSIYDSTMSVELENGNVITTEVPPEYYGVIKEGWEIELTSVLTFRRVLDRNKDQSPDEGENSQDDDRYIDYSQDVSSQSLSQVGGLEEVKNKLMKNVIAPTQQPRLRKNLNLPSTRGVLFYGESGTGKTITAKALTSEIGGNFYPIKGPELVSKYYGETERQIREVFSQAEESAKDSKKPSVVFFDELDSVAPPRADADDTERRIVAQLLSELDGVSRVENLVVIGTTNLIEGIDQAILRPGRFDEKIEFGLPTSKGRVEILSIHLEEVDLRSSVNPEAVAMRTEGFSGADLKEIVTQAKFIALNEFRDYLCKEDFDIALDRWEGS